MLINLRIVVPARRPIALGMLIVATGCGVMLAACQDTQRADGRGGAADGRALVSSDEDAFPRDGDQRERDADAARDSDGTTERGPSADAVPTGPGAGVVRGRVIDAVTKLPVANAVVMLVEPDRRTIAGPDGTFRFDGVEDGPLQIVFGPADGHVPRSTRRRMTQLGLDLGVVALAPAAPAEYITPEFGGQITGCGETSLRVPTEALAVPVGLRVTCVQSDDGLPGPPPSGRLPLAVVHLGPDGVPLQTPAELTVALPAQPRFAEDVGLDLLRLDLDELAWTSVGQATVRPAGDTAVGSVPSLGTYMVVAPSYGALADAQSSEATIRRYAVTMASEPSPASVFPAGTVLVYADFDYAGMRNTPITIRTTDDDGETVFENVRPYTDAGSDRAPMVGPGAQGTWPVGRYETTWYVGDPPRRVGRRIEWRVSDRPTPAPSPVVPPIEVIARAFDLPSRPGGAAAAETGTGPGSDSIFDDPWSRPGRTAACVPAKGWLEYNVRPGDTLSVLAERTATTSSQLMRANCLAGPTIYAGQRILLPVNPFAPPGVPKSPPTTAPGSGRDRAATPVPAKTRLPGAAPTLAPYPTTWYTPQAPVAPVAPTADVPPSDGSGAAPGARPVRVTQPAPVATSETGPVAPPGGSNPAPQPTKVQAPGEPTLAARPTVPGGSPP